MSDFSDTTSPEIKSKDEIENLISNMLEKLGENSEREGLLRTPHRVAKSLRFLTEGYKLDAQKSKTFHGLGRRGKLSHTFRALVTQRAFRPTDERWLTLHRFCG